METKNRNILLTTQKVTSSSPNLLQNLIILLKMNQFILIFFIHKTICLFAKASLSLSVRFIARRSSPSSVTKCRNCSIFYKISLSQILSTKNPVKHQYRKLREIIFLDLQSPEIFFVTFGKIYSHQ